VAVGCRIGQETADRRSCWRAIRQKMVEAGGVGLFSDAGRTLGAAPVDNQMRELSYPHVGQWLAVGSARVPATLVAGNTNNRDDIFVHDRHTDINTRVRLTADRSGRRGIRQLGGQQSGNRQTRVWSRTCSYAHCRGRRRECLPNHEASAGGRVCLRTPRPPARGDSRQNRISRHGHLIQYRVWASDSSTI